ncbi:MAG TPA: MXAN_2562 family outer membrane beta-barrel protein [bacterium]|nr:MXAN_2562 family outer membrane beta-barrel protein [bacterium]
MKRLVVALALLTILCGGSLARAESTQDIHWQESPQWGTWSIHAGLMFFNEEAFADIYGDRGMVFYNMNAGLKLIADLELVGHIGYGFSEGRGISPQEKTKTDEWYKLHMAPGGLGLAYRFKFWLDQPIVPYIGGAGIISYWMEERMESSWKRRGYNYGAIGYGGLMILLDNLERRASGALESAWGINNTYIFYEYRYTSLNNFDADEIVDLGSQFHSLGLMFEF